MSGVPVTVRAELFQFQPCCGIATIFHRRVTGNARRSLVGIGATLGTFQRNNNANAFIFSHNPGKSKT